MKYYFIAGEQSGDLHGGNLIASLCRVDPGARFRGLGGDHMCDQGMSLLVHHRDMDIAGLSFLGSLHTVYALIKKCQRDILSYQPDVVILIDYGGFNLRIARFCKPHGLPVFYYIPPKVWAWGKWRVKTLRNYVDHIFSILPFEKKFYQSFGVEVTYVGNPVWDAVTAFQPDMDFLTQNSLDSQHPLVALLPGSRKRELKKIIPLLEQLVIRYPNYRFVVAAVSSMPNELYAPLMKYAHVSLVTDKTYDLLRCAQAAVVTSGTATLETALLNVPQVVIYRAAALEYFLASFLINVKYVSLVNLIADRWVVKELIQHTATVDNIALEMQKLVEDSAYRTAMQQQYELIRSELNVGSASDNAAKAMIGYLSN